MAKAGAVELWLVRHGETAWSQDGRHTSWSEVPLTEHGRQRALELRQFLAGRKFAALLVSPRQRARETCELAGYGEVAVVDDNLQEWNYGDAEGRTTAEIRRATGNPDWSVWTDPLEGGETPEAVGARADRVIARALELASSTATESHAVALFAHAHILRILAARWIGLDARAGRLFALGTGTVSVLSYERETRVIERWNRSFEE